MDLNLTKPNDRLTVRAFGEQRELFMSFLRQNAVLRVIGEPENMGAMLIDPDVTEMILRIFLAAKPSLTDAADMELTEDALDTETVENILAWVQEHMTYFFVKRFQLVSNQQAALKPLADNLKSLQSGSEP